MWGWVNFKFCVELGTATEYKRKGYGGSVKAAAKMGWGDLGGSFEYLFGEPTLIIASVKALGLNDNPKHTMETLCRRVISFA